MKPFLLLCTLLTVFFCFVLNSRLDQRATELAAAQARIKATEAQRVPRADFDSARRDLSEADQKIMTLEDELKNARVRTAALTERVAALQSQAALPRPDKPGAVAKPGLIKGGYTMMDESVVYFPDSQFRLGNDLLVSSPKGMMVSDKEQEIFGGDLLLQTPQGTIKSDDAMLEINGDNATLTGKQVTVTLRRTADAGETGRTAPASVP